MNLPAFPPSDLASQAFHRFWLSFYSNFQSAARCCGITVEKQPEVLEKAHRALWAFGRYAVPGEDASGHYLEIDSQVFQQNFKFSRPEEVFSLLNALGVPIALRIADEWSTRGKLKTSEAARLLFQDHAEGTTVTLAQTLPTLVGAILARTPKDLQAFERFLRADPQAVLGGDKPPLDLEADAPVILANLPVPAAEAWQELVRFMKGFPAYQPEVEFRSIYPGLWNVNYISRDGGKDLAALTIQNVRMTVRIIL